jgi:hypothetical protein
MPGRPPSSSRDLPSRPWNYTVCYVWVIMRFDTRQIAHLALSPSRTLAWVKQQIRDERPHWAKPNPRQRQCAARKQARAWRSSARLSPRRIDFAATRISPPLLCRALWSFCGLSCDRDSRRNKGVRRGRPAHNGLANLVRNRPIALSRVTAVTRTSSLAAISFESGRGHPPRSAEVVGAFLPKLPG